ncbi:hypothetical protein U6A24_21690 [Aquimarina gracilis]|uniref:Uncharacterized protein n=1 Tax=Aquimarina gracilis TaxID=874422 RepID=A0ABU6A1U7_9FLAO|nr:hypothetical protein [Aquimarina gracilis]MEB3348104.1 hypothetical protein [Aquimarina gracilis]
MKKLSILLFFIASIVFYSCEKESIEDQTNLQIKEDTSITQSKWFGYCNSFKGKVIFGQTSTLDFGDHQFGSRTGTLILERCPNGTGSCTQVIQLNVEHNKNFTFYTLGSEFSDSDRFRIRIIPNEDGPWPTAFTRLNFGPAYGQIQNLGRSDIRFIATTYNNVALDFPEVCQ